MQINRNSPVARFNHKVGIAKSDADAIAAMQVLMDPVSYTHLTLPTILRV